MTITNEHILKYERYIGAVARSHSRKISNGNDYEISGTERVLNLMGQTVEDIKQELRLAAFMALQEFHSKVEQGITMLVYEGVYVRQAIKFKKNMLLRDMFAESQGQQFSHMSDQVLYKT